MAIKYSIPTPKSPFVDLKTGVVARDWFLYLQNVFNSVSTTAGSGVTASTGALITNQLIIADGPADIVSLNSLTVSSIVVATSSGAIATQPGLGTSTRVLHGNATGFPSYAAVNMAADVTGILPVGNGGTNTSSLAGNLFMRSNAGGTQIVEATSLANGQLFIGSTGAFPVATTLTASTGISITNSPGSIAIAATGTLVSKVVTTTRDLTTSSGTQSVTGVGFRPTSIIFLAEVTGRPEASQGYSDSGSSASCIYVDGNASTWNQSSTAAIVMSDPVSGGNSAALSSYDIDGYTLSWTRSGAPNGTSRIFSLCYR